MNSVRADRGDYSRRRIFENLFHVVEKRWSSFVVYCCCDFLKHPLGSLKWERVCFSSVVVSLSLLVCFLSLIGSDEAFFKYPKMAKLNGSWVHRAIKYCLYKCSKYRTTWRWFAEGEYLKLSVAIINIFLSYKLTLRLKMSDTAHMTLSRGNKNISPRISNANSLYFVISHKNNCIMVMCLC